MTTASAEIDAAPAEDATHRRWPGFDALVESQADRFFGRDEEIATITRQFERPKSGQAALVWLHGASGCGKTSLIQAGVCPALRKDLGAGFQAVRIVPENGSTGNELIDAIAGAILRETHADSEDIALDVESQMRQFSLLHRQDPSEAAEYLASSFIESRPVGIDDREKSICLVIVDQLENLSPAKSSILPDRDPTWKINTLQPVLIFLHDLLMTGTFPVLVGMRSPNAEIVKNALSDCDYPTLGHWDEIEPPNLDDARRLFESAPAQLVEGEQVNVEPMLLDALIDDAGNTSAGIPFISETLRRLSEFDPASETLSTADVGWAGGIAEKYAAAAERAVPENLDDHDLGELMLALQRTVRSGKNKGENVPSKAKIFDVITRSKTSQAFVENLIDNRVLALSGHSPGSAEIEWTIPDALKNWDRAKKWFQEEERRLEKAQRFETKREEWEKENRSPVLLEHAHFALKDAEKLLAHHQQRPFLSEEVIDFINRSLVLDERLTEEIQSGKSRANLIKYGGIGLAGPIVIFLIWWFFLR